MPNTDPVARANYHREYSKKKRKKNIDAGNCRCGKPRAENRLRCSDCIETAKVSQKRIFAERRRNGICSHCTRSTVRGKARCEACSKVASDYIARLKIDVMNAYGGKCACCGESEMSFLTIDHVFGDGGVQRKVVRPSRMYNWLKKHGYPKDRYQCLCFNCNCGRQVNGGVCPHQKKQLRTEFA